MTITELENAGYIIHHTAFRKGYISRKTVIGTIRAELVESGRYKGLYRAWLPNWGSTQYAIVRYYFKGQKT